MRKGFLGVLSFAFALTSLAQPVSGPLVSTNRGVPVFTQTNGKKIDPSPVYIDATGNLYFGGPGTVIVNDMTTVERNVLAATNGMVIYNTTDAKLQMRENGAWVDIGTSAATGVFMSNFDQDWFRTNGAIVRPALTKTLPHWVNVTDVAYGATTASGNNDFAALQAAADAATNGSTIYVPVGTYEIDNPTSQGIVINNRANITIIGDGPGSLIKRRAGSPLTSRLFTFQSCTNITIRNMGFDANGISQYGGVVFYSCKRVAITGNSYIDSNKLGGGATDRYAFVLGAGGDYHEDVSITDNLIKDLQLEPDHGRRVKVKRNTSYRTVRTVAIGVASIVDNETLEDYDISDNLIIDPDASSGAIGVIIDPNTNTNCVFRRFTIANNFILNNTNIGPVRAIHLGTTSTVTATTSNVFEDFNVFGNYCYYASGVVHNPDAAIAMLTSATANFNFVRLSVRNNTVIGGGQVESGIDVRRTVDSDISDNYVHGTTSAGIGVTTANSTTVSGNRIGDVAGIGYSFTDSHGTNIFNDNTLAGSLPATQFNLNLAATDQYVINRSNRTEITASLSTLGHLAAGSPTNAFLASSSAGNSYVVGKLGLGWQGTPGYQLDVALEQRIWGIGSVGRLIFEELGAPTRRYQLGAAGGHNADEWVISDSTAGQSRLVLRTNGTVEIFAGLTITSNLTVNATPYPDDYVLMVAGGVAAFRSLPAGSGGGGGGSGTNALQSATVTGSGTNYPITDTYALVDFGGGDPSLVLPGAGKYLLLATFSGSSANTFQKDYKFRDVTAGVDASTNDIASLIGSATYSIAVHAIYESPGANTVQLWSRMNDPAYAGVHEVISTNTTFSYVKLAGTGSEAFFNAGSISSPNFRNVTATGTIPSVTYNVAGGTNIDTVIGPASATEAGVVTAGAQDFDGPKTFLDSVRITNALSANSLVVSNNAAVTGNLDVDGILSVGALASVESEINGKALVSHVHAFSALTAGSNSVQMAGNFKDSFTRKSQAGTLSGATPTVDWQTEPLKFHIVSAPITYGEANRPTSSTAGESLEIHMTNSTGSDQPIVLPAGWRDETGVGFTNLVAGKTATIYSKWNSAEVKFYWRTYEPP